MFDIYGEENGDFGVKEIRAALCSFVYAPGLLFFLVFIAIAGFRWVGRAGRGFDRTVIIGRRGRDRAIGIG